MDRRHFMRMLGLAGLTSLPVSPLRAAPGDELYSGPFYINLSVEGGWDVTSFCDPKENSNGNPVINHWASEGGTIQAIDGSPITYAPFARNAEFFTRFANDMLVINGIDAQTNAHDAGVRHNWSGRLAPGYPSFAALCASIYGPNLPLAFISNGGYKETAGLTPYTLMQNPQTLQNLVAVNKVQWGDYFYNSTADLDAIREYQQNRLDLLGQRANMLPREQLALNMMAAARSNTTTLDRLADTIPETLVSATDQDGYWNPLLQQAELAIAAYRAGLCVACDMSIGGFDTHADHDEQHTEAMQRLVNGITFLWDTAEAHGIADQLRIVITSDFSRTPNYNDTDGKDHWPIGSAIFMQRGANWTNRVIGQTTNTHDAMTLNAATLQLDSSASGIQLYPMHIHDLMRRWAGIDSHIITQAFPLGAESLDFFNPALNT